MLYAAICISTTAGAGTGSDGGAGPDALSRGCPPALRGGSFPACVLAALWRGVPQEEFAQLEMALPVLAGKTAAAAPPEPELGGPGTSRDPVPPEYSIERLTCAIASRLRGDGWLAGCCSRSWVVGAQARECGAPPPRQPVRYGPPDRLWSRRWRDSSLAGAGQRSSP